MLASQLFSIVALIARAQAVPFVKYRREAALLAGPGEDAEVPTDPESTPSPMATDSAGATPAPSIDDSDTETSSDPYVSANPTLCNSTMFGANGTFNVSDFNSTDILRANMSCLPPNVTINNTETTSSPIPSAAETDASQCALASLSAGSDNPGHGYGMGGSKGKGDGGENHEDNSENAASESEGKPAQSESEEDEPDYDESEDESEDESADDTAVPAGDQNEKRDFADCIRSIFGGEETADDTQASSSAPSGPGGQWSPPGGHTTHGLPPPMMGGGNPGGKCGNDSEGSDVAAPSSLTPNPSNASVFPSPPDPSASLVSDHSAPSESPSVASSSDIYRRNYVLRRSPEITASAADQSGSAGSGYALSAEPYDSTSADSIIASGPSPTSLDSSATPTGDGGLPGSGSGSEDSGPSGIESVSCDGPGSGKDSHGGKGRHGHGHGHGHGKGGSKGKGKGGENHSDNSQDDKHGKGSKGGDLSKSSGGDYTSTPLSAGSEDIPATPSAGSEDVVATAAAGGGEVSRAVLSTQDDLGPPSWRRHPHVPSA